MTLTNIFWAVVALDVIAAVVLKLVFDSGSHGQFDGLLVAFFLVVLGAIVLTACVFPLLRTDGWRMAAFVVLLIPSVPMVFSSGASVVNRIRTERQFSGSAYFQGPALALAQAMVKGDVELAKQLIPAAGDLNQPHGGKATLWQFGVLQTYDTDASMEMLRVLVAAGADPKRDGSADTLQHAIARGPGLTKYLLEAGVSPNVLDHDGRPVWWGTMGPGEDEASTELLRMMLDHGADLRLRAPDGRGPVGVAVTNRHWFDACLFLERGAEWKQEQLRGGSVAELLEWEILRRGEYGIPVPETMLTVMAGLKGKPLVIPPGGEIGILKILRETSFDRLEETRAAVALLAQQPQWVRRVDAFFEDGNTTMRGQVALVLSMQPEALPEDVQERCWTVLREQVAGFERSARSTKEPSGWLLKDTAVIAVGLASIASPVRERHRADFIGLRDHIEKLRKTNDPDAGKLADLRKADWVAGA